ncbi:MAG: sigma 54-interacting transcriptional regulator, partial [Gammaproteobacteria bacterium]|nr:sigma 54-interacting transcriptional regulator [Gammaproteobacteria bacterium]
AQGIAGVFLYSRSSITSAFEEALQLVLARRAERSGRERLASVLRHLGQGVVATDAQGLILAANPAADALTGAALGAAVGRPLADVVPALDPDRHVRGAESAAMPRVQRLMGQDVLVKALPVMEGGHPDGAVFTLERSSTVEQAFRRLRAHDRARPRPARYTLAHVVQASPQMQALVRRCEILAGHADATVLITGPTGVGKELVAQGIHSASRRRGQAFVAVNCGALAPTLLESELFGYEEGAFTGARREGRAGLFEAANGGTLLLDEIGELPLDLQTRLLRVLQEREVTRVGGHAPMPVDIRVISATHQDLRVAVQEGRFREDLYYRIAVLRVDIPPLADRPADLEALASIMVGAALREAGLSELVEGVSNALPAVLRTHDWPGNAREMQNFAQRVALCCLERQGVPSAGELRALIDAPLPEVGAPIDPPALPTLGEKRAGDELRHIRQVLAECGGSQAEAARRLGISRTTMWRRLRSEKA